MSLKVNYFAEDIKFKLSNKRAISNLIKHINGSNKSLNGEVNYIFCSDSYLLEINQMYLNHDTYTDIITFENYEPSGLLMSDIYISIDRVKENALKFKVEFEKELVRVLSHGMLHLNGYKDKSKLDRLIMTEKENECIHQFYNQLT